MTAQEILARRNLALGTAKKQEVRHAYFLADDGEVIQAGDALTLFRNDDPRLHTTMMLTTALLNLGCVKTNK